MPRPREEADVASERFTIHVTPSMLAFIDSRRGTRSRAKYVRDLIREDAGR